MITWHLNDILVIYHIADFSLFGRMNDKKFTYRLKANGSSSNISSFWFVFYRFIYMHVR